jgi:hypothetical protein
MSMSLITFGELLLLVAVFATLCFIPFVCSFDEQWIGGVLADHDSIAFFPFLFCCIVMIGIISSMMYIWQERSNGYPSWNEARI